MTFDPRYPPPGSPPQGISPGLPSVPAAGPLYRPSGYPPAQAVQRGPSGGTAITAVVLSLLGSLHMALMAALGATETVQWGSNGVSAHISQVAVSLMATLTAMGACALLAAGGIQTLRRRPVGRWLIAAGCGASLLMVVVSGLFVLWATAGAFFVISPLAILSGVLTLLFSIVTVVLALVPSTAAWLRSGG